MKYDKTAPCDTCPFVRGTVVKLHPDRIDEITGVMLDFQGGTFQCHKTFNPDDEKPKCSWKGAQHCAGALIFALKHDTLPQMARIASRLGMFNPDKIMADTAITDTVYDSVEQMQEDHAIEKNKCPN